MATIDLKQVLDIIRSGDWCDLKFFTADTVKNKGGKILHFPKCRIARRKSMIESGAEVNSLTGFNKSASHNLHFTINVEMENGQIRKIHPILIFEINKQKVA